MRYEYRVLCYDGEHRWGSALRYATSADRAFNMAERASSDSGCSCDGEVANRGNHPHSVERREVGAWAVTAIQRSAFRSPTALVANPEEG